MAKDIFALSCFLVFFATFVFYFPNTLNHPDNYIVADPLETPAHVVPEWYCAPSNYFQICRIFLNRLYTIYLVKQLTYLKSKDLGECSMLVKGRITIVSFGRFLSELYVYVFQLLIMRVYRAYGIANINPYFLN